MKNLFEKIKDVLYDGVDYIMMLIVIIVVALVINWRLGGLFATDAEDTLGESPSNITDTNKDIGSNDKEKPANIGDSNQDPEETIDENEDEDNDNIEEVIKINIPPGSLPSKIGDILASEGLVKDKNTFVQKAIDLKLETKLKYGEFEITKGSSMEDILAILTK